MLPVHYAFLSVTLAPDPIASLSAEGQLLVLIAQLPTSSSSIHAPGDSGADREALGLKSSSEGKHRISARPREISIVHSVPGYEIHMRAPQMEFAQLVC